MPSPCFKPMSGRILVNDLDIVESPLAVQARRRRLFPASSFATFQSVGNYYRQNLYLSI